MSFPLGIFDTVENALQAAQTEAQEPVYRRDFVFGFGILAEAVDDGATPDVQELTADLAGHLRERWLIHRVDGVRTATK